MKKDATRTLLDFLDRLDKSPDKAKAAVKILGQEWWDEGARAAQALPEILRLMDLIQSRKWKGSLDRNQEIDLATTDNHLKRMGVIVSEIGDRLGRWALPPINEGLEGLISVFERLEEAQRRSAEGSGIMNKGVNDKLTSREVDRLSSDPELRERLKRHRSASQQALDAARAERRSLRERIERTRKSGSLSGMDHLTPMYDRMRALDKKIEALQSRVEPAREHAAEGARGRLALPVDPKQVDELKAKLLQLDGVMKTLQLAPNSEEARQKAQKLVDELTGVFQRADLSPEARKVIDSYAAGLAAQGGKVDAAAEAIRARLQQILGAPIVVKIEPRLSGAKGVGGATGAASASGGGGSTPKKGAMRGDVHIREAHFHGVRDVASLHRSVMAAADRRARSARDGALHDIDAG